MAPYVKVPARCLHAIPDSLPFALACLAEPHAVAYNAMCVNSTIRPGDLVVVLGPGPIGLLCARMAALAGADPLIVVGLPADAARLETATRLGATHVVDARAANVEEIVRAIESARRRSGVRRHRARAIPRACARAGPAGRPGDQGRLVAGSRAAATSIRWCRRTSGCRARSATTIPIWERVIHLLDRRRDAPDEIVGLTSPLEGWRERVRRDARRAGDQVGAGPVSALAGKSRGHHRMRPRASAAASPNTSPGSAPTWSCTAAIAATASKPCAGVQAAGARGRILRRRSHGARRSAAG